jgi:hypothetical protein
MTRTTLLGKRVRAVVGCTCAVVLSMQMQTQMQSVAGFGGLESALPSLIHQAQASSSVLSFHDAAMTLASTSSAPASPAGAFDFHLLERYKHSLIQHPLATKMATGATLAVVGDAIAQSRTVTVEEPYDKRRAASFAVFDMCYRAGQHMLFPIIVAACHGQYLGEILPGLSPLISTVTHAENPATLLAAMEQTLASQLGIVPFLYYPVFFSLTGVVMGLTTEQTLVRAKDTFVPLMKRNLLFWIPVQFVQFGFVEESLQIPFLSACGLGWTFILSVMAGSTKQYAATAVAANDITAAADDDEADAQIQLLLQEDVDFLGQSTSSSSSSAPMPYDLNEKVVAEEKKKELVAR